LTQIDDALTAAAIVIGGAFAYLKFVKGRVLTAAVGYEIRAAVPAHATRRHLPRPSFTPVAGVIAVEVPIRNNDLRRRRREPRPGHLAGYRAGRPGPPPLRAGTAQRVLAPHVLYAAFSSLPAAWP
jgi:hypothetical protein